MKEYRVILCREFVERCEDYELDYEDFAKLLNRRGVPVQKLSDGMKDSNGQCSFNIDEGFLKVIDPFNLFHCDQKKFDLDLENWKIGKDIAKSNFGAKMVELRNKAGFSQLELSEKAGLAQAHLSRIENGKYMPRVDIVKKIADVLGCSMDDFFKTS